MNGPCYCESLLLARWLIIVRNKLASAKNAARQDADRSTDQQGGSVPKSTKKQIRALWLQVHKWIGLVLAVLIIPISLTGAALVWHDWVDAQLEPQRHAILGSAALPASAYAAAASAALAPEERRTAAYAKALGLTAESDLAQGKGAQGLARLTQSVAAWREALEAAPNDAHARLALAKALHRLGALHLLHRTPG